MFQFVTINSLFALLALTCVAADESSGVNLLVLGDWGGLPFPPYAMPAQMHVAAAMGVMGEKINAQAVIALGDNFYFCKLLTLYTMITSWMNILSY